jgi:UDP-N-acetylglucosamine 4,6-dehydratase/5-epimerase
MRRFFFTVDQAVNLVLTALELADELQGRVLARHMKAARIRDILDLWVHHRGGSWQQITERPGERNDEFLIGDLELPFTAERCIDGIPHYIVSFNERAPNPLPVGLSSANTDRLSEAELLAILDNPASEEL